MSFEMSDNYENAFLSRTLEIDCKNLSKKPNNPENGTNARSRMRNVISMFLTAVLATASVVY